MALTKVTGEGVGAVTNQFSSANMPAGHILQTVTATSSTANATSSTSWVATSVTVTITPSSTASKILILHQGVLNKQSINSWQWFTLYRGSTNLAAGGSADAMGGMYTNASSDSHLPVTINHLDSPSTASAVTYQVYQKVQSGAARYNGDSFKLTITAIEIKG